MKNSIRLDFADNPDLKSLFANRKAGEKAKVLVHFQINSQDDAGLDGSIETVAASDDIDIDQDTEKMEDEGPRKTKIDADYDQPVAMLLNGGSAKPAPAG